jgi:hypothetical protein
MPRWRRLALARAILRDPAILVLDEATSALDPATESAVNATLERLSRDRTVISVTHRLTSIANFDCIFVMDAGKLVEQGKHKELLNLKGIYFEMWQEFGLELTGDVLLGERADVEPKQPPGARGREPDEEIADIDRLLEVDTVELTELISQFEAEEKGQDQEAQRLRDVNQRWAQLVGTDRLTGLPNRLSFLEVPGAHRDPAGPEAKRTGGIPAVVGGQSRYRQRTPRKKRRRPGAGRPGRIAAIHHQGGGAPGASGRH